MGDHVMIERYVFVKLEPEADSESERDRFVERIRALCRALPAASVTLAVPADASARAAWDLALSLRFASEADAAQYTESALHRELTEGGALGRVAVVKTWSFQVV